MKMKLVRNKKSSTPGIVVKYSCIFELCSKRGWSVEQFFIFAAQRGAPRLRASTILRDVEYFNEAEAGIVPTYVWDYAKRLLAVESRNCRRKLAKKLSSQYVRPSPARVRW